MLAPGSLLAQSRPSGTTAVEAFAASLRTEVTLIAVCNTTGSAVDFSVYHDDAGGSTFDQSTALHYEQALAANATVYLAAAAMYGGFALKPGGQIGIRTATASALNFSIYGVTQEIAAASR